MSDVMAIVAKAVFEKAAGKTPVLGTALGMDRYISANKGLSPLEGGGRLFLVTVRPPNEALWLVAVLDNPTFSGTEWVATKCATTMTDISGLKTQLKFESGQGLPTAAGKLGMSLQTPRVLTATDVALLQGALGGTIAAPAPAPVAATPAIDTARIELGEVDLALRNPMSVPKRQVLRAKRDELLTTNSARWWPWMGSVLAQRQKGGKVTWIRAEASAFLGIAAKVFAAEPVVELELLGVDEEMAGELAKCAWLAKLSSLGVHSELGDEGFATLVKSKHLGALVALNVSGNGLSSEGIGAMEKALPSLQRLVLTNNPIGDEGVEAFVEWKHLSGLRTLYLTACELGDGACIALATSGKLGALEKLTLANNEEIGDAGITALANAKALPNLRYLELKNLGLKDVSGAALAAAAFPHLNHLDLRGAWGVKRDQLRAVYPGALTE